MRRAVAKHVQHHSRVEKSMNIAQLPFGRIVGRIETIGPTTSRHRQVEGAEGRYFNADDLGAAQFV
jgi:hypothetical protein